MTEALYRKYRSQDFDAMVGQQHVTKLLKAQVAKGEVSHAYLFSGTRGTGKTSAAKIFARAINCLQPVEGNPCNTCAHCKGILEGRVMDVVEMDAASNNSVDDVRELREKAIYPPATVDYRVYIVDEVHMLSKGAFNALLKILEEPPRHLIFILATTEPERIPGTILSRCQRYDFHRITAEAMLQHLKTVVDAEERVVDEDVLRLIVRHADGAMRDALSLLDQCMALADKHITLADALEILGMVGTEALEKLVLDVLNQDGPAILRNLRDWRTTGKDSLPILNEIISFFRDMMMAEIGEVSYMDPALLAMTSMEDTLARLEHLLSLQQEIKLSPTPDILLDVGILVLMDMDKLNLARRVEALEKQLNQGDFPKAPKGQKEPVPKREKAAKTEPKPNRQAKGQEGIKTEKNPVNRAEGEAEMPEAESGEKEGETAEMPMPSSTSGDEEKWNQLVEYIRSHCFPTYPLVDKANFVSCQQGQLVIEFPSGDNFNSRAIKEAIHRQQVEAAATKIWDSPCTLQVKEQLKTKEDRRDDAIARAKQLFGVEIVDIE